ncbi:3-mercaptopyruvate sulfurtransferase-like isoform X2 [Dendronephthya gigantea]|uniref:3-mercaptopyruvate sulfurtransferase-like isoform X2 n=1 Tax=Dendronephthya gigantea TaxID=151771 RepID=UPI00106C1D4A|nr:3-mercaptopyruvate sulfurtransferase-like isoform X2 [Dendronephthya gigantea]
MKLPSLVSVSWLAQTILKTKPLKSLSVVHTTVRTDGQDFLDNHIPGAVYFNVDECCDRTSMYPHMLPNEKLFTEYVQHLGITNDSHIIAYDNDDDYGVFSSPRVWWTFRCFGHKAISILNGGFHKWLAAGLPVESGEAKPIKSDQPFTAKLNPDLVRDYEAMVANVNSGGAQTVLDARGRARFLGEGIEPRPGMLVGHIPFSQNVPYLELLDDERALMKDDEQLKEVFAKHNVDLNRPITTTCGSGITACMVALAAHQSGAKDVSVYDGSWAEWGKRATPDLVERN